MITVIVPFKNAKDFLGRCLQSLTDQDGDFEFILVDDNGEETEDFGIAFEYVVKDKRFSLIGNENKPGVSGARNTGLKHATGEWITFLDADDTMNAGAYQKFKDAIDAAGDWNILQFNHNRHYAKIHKTALKYTNQPGDYNLRRMPVLWCVVWNKLYRAEFLKGIKFDTSMQFAEDELFNVECLENDGRIKCVNGVTTTHYFEDRNSLSKQKTEKDIFKHSQALTNAVKKSKNPELRRAMCMRLSEHWSHLFMDTLTDGK